MLLLNQSRTTQNKQKIVRIFHLAWVIFQVTMFQVLVHQQNNNTLGRGKTEIFNSYEHGILSRIFSLE